MKAEFNVMSYLVFLLIINLWSVVECVLEDCNPEFSRIYPGCKRIRTTLIGDDLGVRAMQDLLLDSMTEDAHVILVEYKDHMSIEALGLMSDYYLQSRPYWTVYHEEYPWQKHRTNHIIYIRVRNIDHILLDISQILNPQNCSNHRLTFRGYYDFDEYGNEHNNLAGYFEQFLGIITLVHIREHAKFIDDGYCPNEINKYNCAFLPMTNCSLPDHYLNCSNFDEQCTPGNSVYSAGTPEAEIIWKNHDEHGFQQTISRPTIQRPGVAGDEFKSESAFDFENFSSRKYSFDGIGSLIYTAIFLRRNYDFRTRIAKMIHTFRRSSKPAFNANDQCVAIHIRHHDRVKPGYDMLKYCSEFVRISRKECHNKTDGKPIEPDCRNGWDFDYACNSAVPFGGITFAAYLKAAALLMDNTINVTKTVFIMTDDGAWVDQEKQPFVGEWNIQVLPAQPRHRSRATINGVTLFSSIELVQQCTGLVGHTVSAFTVLLRAMMCIRHGPKNNIRFGECPKFYDFRALSNSR